MVPSVLYTGILSNSWLHVFFNSCYSNIHKIITTKIFPKGKDWKEWLKSSWERCFTRNNSKPFGFLFFVPWLCLIWVDPLSPKHRMLELHNWKATAKQCKTMCCEVQNNWISKTRKICCPISPLNLPAMVHQIWAKQWTRLTLRPGPQDAPTIKRQLLKTNFASSDLFKLYLPVPSASSLPSVLDRYIFDLWKCIVESTGVFQHNIKMHAYLRHVKPCGRFATGFSKKHLWKEASVDLDHRYLL